MQCSGFSAAKKSKTMPPDQLPSEKLGVPASSPNHHECRPDPRRNNVAATSLSTPFTTEATPPTIQTTNETTPPPRGANAALTRLPTHLFTLVRPITAAPPLSATASFNPPPNSNHLPSSRRHHNHVQSRNFHPRFPNTRPCSPNTACPHRRGRSMAPRAQFGFPLPSHRISTISPLSRPRPYREVREAAAAAARRVRI